MLDTKISDFTLPATGGQDFNLATQAGKVVVIYFYPKDSTPGCTTEAQQFRDLYPEFVAVDAVILGISRDSLKSVSYTHLDVYKRQTSLGLRFFSQRCDRV